MVAVEEEIDNEITKLTIGEPTWRKIQKKLIPSDLNELILSNHQVHNYILPFIHSNQDQNKIHTDEGLTVTVEDEDKGTDHEYKLTFKRCKSSNSYVLQSNWHRDFVAKRELVVNDTIQIYWSQFRQRFYFKVVAAKHNIQQQPPTTTYNGLQLALGFQEEEEEKEEEEQYPLQCLPPNQSLDVVIDRLHGIPTPKLLPLIDVLENRLQQQLSPPPSLLLLGDVVDDTLRL